MASDTLFGVHGAALQVRSQRMGLLASNIANASTPGFKAKDIDFQTALSAVQHSDAADTNSISSAVR
jgi:flagellar basal-body rod protein FlgB